MKSAQSDVIATKKASQHGTNEPRFLWFPFLPYKKLTVLQGESGIGKSSFILNIAALLSNGHHMPFESSGLKSAPILVLDEASANLNTVIWHRLGFNAQWNIRDTARNKMRSAMAVKS